MDIQVLVVNQKDNRFAGDGVVINSLHKPQSLDEFDINIIDLNNEHIWVDDSHSGGSINMINDFISLSEMIRGSIKTKILVLLPQNIYYRWAYYENKYLYQAELKDRLEFVRDTLVVLSPSLVNVYLIYENTKTNITDNKVEAAFFFNIPEECVLIKSEKSHKPTVIVSDNKIIASTLNIQSYDEIIGLLTELHIIQKKQSIPPWIKEIHMFDDNKQAKIIEENKQIIKTANDNIVEAMEKINKNNEYKSILYTTGEELVKVVFEILETLLGCDLSQFEDKKREDFLFEIGDTVFIGEIKGVNHNVKNENVSQLDVHYQSYLDENADKDEEQVKAMLIMNHQKNKPLENREPVHEKQINLACRNKSLIIETITLLKLFEKYITKEKSRDECLDLLKATSGLLII